MLFDSAKTRKSCQVLFSPSTCLRLVSHKSCRVLPSLSLDSWVHKNHTSIYLMSWVFLESFSSCWVLLSHGSTKTLPSQSVWQHWMWCLCMFQRKIGICYNKDKKCIFIGYKDGIKGYKIWNASARTIVYSIDVIFKEYESNSENEQVKREK